MNGLKTLSLGMAMLALSACATGPQLAPAGTYSAGSYDVTLATDWNAIPIKTGKGKAAHLLTLDGPLLNAVYLFDDLRPGDSILKQVRKENPVPKFDEDYSDLELVEFITDSLVKGMGLVSLAPDNIRPDSFNGEDAIRFDMRARTGNGLNLSGEALLAVRDGMLDVIIFMAPTEYYADKDRANIDAIFDSVASGNPVG